MPFGYLITVVFVALCVASALRPIRRPDRVVRATWFFGIVPNDLPFFVLAFLVLSTVLAFVEGDIHAPVGWAALGIAAAATLGLVVTAARALRTGPAVQAALREGLGVDPPRRRLAWARILLAPLSVTRLDVERIADIPYGDAGEHNLLDLYRSPSSAPAGPTLIHLHGGGFRSGKKNREARPLLYRLASRGWLCISANYRLRPDAAFPDQLVDVKRVIGWVRAHAHEYGGDPTVVFVAGSSAGGHLASMAALTPNDAAYQPGFEEVETSVSAAITFSGYYGRIEDEHPASSPLAHVGAQAPPFFVAHGELDSYVPVAAAQEFVDALRHGSSTPVVYAELPGGQHSFDLFHSVRFERVVDGIEAFAAWVRSRQRSER